jgi:hypothetical protein
MMEMLSSSETSVLTIATWRNILGGAILQYLVWPRYCNLLKKLLVEMEGSENCYLEEH